MQHRSPQRHWSTRLLVVAFAAAAVCAGGASDLGARSTEPAARLGPGPISTVLNANGYRLGLKMAPNRASAAGRIALELRTRRGPVHGARVKVTLTMLDMNMGNMWSVLSEGATGRYAQSVPPLGMPGHWRLRFDVRPRGKAAFTVSVVDVMHA
jgi:hypothetical protein